MGAENSSIKIEMLDSSNCDFCKICIRNILTLEDLENLQAEDPPVAFSTPAEIAL